MARHFPVTTELNVAELLRQVADELESHPSDVHAMSHMSQARLKRLIIDLTEARDLRKYNPRTDRVKQRLDCSYIPELRPTEPDEDRAHGVKIP